MHKILKGEKTTNFDGIKLPAEGREISALQQEEGYKYLGVLEASDVLQELGIENKTDKGILSQDKIDSEVEVEQRLCCRSY